MICTTLLQDTMTSSARDFAIKGEAATQKSRVAGESGVAKPGRPRNLTVRAAVLKAAYQVLVEAGLQAFTIEAVAAASGVARTTVYRSWPTRGHLLMDSFLSVYQLQIHFEVSESPVEDVQRLVRSLAQALNGPAGKVAASILAEAQSNPQLKELFCEQFSRPLRERSAALIRAGVTSEIFRPDLDVERMVDAIVGGAYLRLLFGEPLSRTWADSFSKNLLFGACAIRK